MPKRVFDTNILISHFHQLRPLEGKGEREAEEWARSLISSRNGNAIVSPVEVEFLCGVVNQHEIRLREAYLRTFKVVDDHKTIPQDWDEARRLAKHAGFHAEPRDLGDCLISAISDRLNLELVTGDKGLIRQRGRTRRRRP
jgi:predicted nucleic acid-binding protein